MKQADPEARMCFIGPCAAKKLEASRRTVRSDVDFVLTFEELAGIIEAKDLDLASLEVDPTEQDLIHASAAGRGFAQSGGVAKAVADKQGWDVDYEAIDWDAKDTLLNSGAINCIWNGFTYTGRENDYTFSDPYVDNSIVMVVKADSGITSLADLAGKSVMAQAASSAVDAINENEDFKASLKEVVELGDYNMGFMDLAQGTVDAVAADLGVAQYQIANNDGDYVILDEPLSTEQYAIGFLKGNTELRDAVNAELLKMAEDGTMLEIAQKYVDQGLVLDSLCLINK